MPENLIRSFVAVPALDPALGDLLARLTPLARLRWVTKEQLHITLRFLGEQTPERIQKIKAALRPLALSPFEIELNRAGAFPSFERPRVLWLAGERGARELADLAARVNDALFKAGIPREARGFQPHLTLARAEGTSPFPRPLLKALEGISFGWRCEGFALMQSRLTPQGAVYSRIGP